jgi:nicotinamidase-related amidase
MATIRSGEQPALLVVDVQQGVVAQAWERDRVVARVAFAVERARAAGVPVFWVQHESDELERGSEAWRWVPELQPRDGEAAIHKRFNSAFEQTELEARLAALGATHLVLAGAASNWCIRATAYAALERGYDLTLLGDAHTTPDLDLGAGRVVAARDVIDELNAVMRWIAYPGRRNRVLGAEALDFGRPAPALAG